jgi:exopolysaccharide biosynthesis predicted pyruvyltransferase EpsI
MSISELLERYREQKIYLQLLPGNLGDDLIVEGLKYQLEEAGIKLITSASEADVLLVKGGGHVLTGMYDTTERALFEVMDLNPQANLVLLPQSCLECSPQALTRLNSHQGRLIIYARDHFSRERLEAYSWAAHVELATDHDSALCLSSSPLIERLRKTQRNDYHLIVERLDVEAATSRAADLSFPKRVSPGIKWFVPASTKRAVKRWVLGRRARSTHFGRCCAKALSHDHPEWATLPVRYCDLSQRSMFDFQQFLSAVANAATVSTTRLHVGILAALLGKPTYMYDSPAGYRKLEGVYRYSMRDMPHVRLRPIPEA